MLTDQFRNKKQTHSEIAAKNHCKTDIVEVWHTLQIAKNKTTDLRHVQ